MSRNYVDENGNLVPIAGNPEDTNFEGTQAEWDALSLAQKARFITVDITNDLNYAPPLDNALSLSSERAVMNKVITAKVNELEEKAPKVSIGYFDVDLAGLAVTSHDIGYYAAKSINSSIPSGMFPISVAFVGAYTGGISVTLKCESDNTSWYIIVGSPVSFTFPSSRKARVYYVPYL